MGKGFRRMGRGISSLLAIAAAFCLVDQSLFAQSLWGKSTRSYYDDPKPVPFKKHDHIQIVVLEKSKGSAAADLHTDQRTRWEASLDDWIKFIKSGEGHTTLGSSDTKNVKPGINLDARLRKDNLGKTTRQFELAFTITAEVVDIRPNGNLVLEAKKERTVNGETESVTLSGECAPSAVAGGTIRSDRVANMKVKLEGNGDVNSAQRPGWLGWILGVLWPF